MIKNIVCFQFSLLILLSVSSQQIESSVKAEFQDVVSISTEVVVSGLDIPWGMVFLPDGSILITEKSGKLIHYKDGFKTEIGGLPKVYVRGQGGFMDIELHPNYVENKWIYFSYSSSEGVGKGGNTAIFRSKLVDGKLIENQLLYKAFPNTKRGQHFGGHLEFDNDGYLYFSVGDRGNRDKNPQDLTIDCGKIYRIYDDGRIPEDNPFVNTKGFKGAIYSYGHRNPQGLAKHPLTGAIWSHEHGPRGGDEINIIKPSKNYGWPIVSYGINYSGTKFTDTTDKEGMESPLFYWVPSIAPSGMLFVTSDKYPDWNLDILVGSLKFEYLERLVLKNNKVVKRERLLDGVGRVRSLRQGLDGFIYVGVENVGILRIIPKN